MSIIITITHRERARSGSPGHIHGRACFPELTAHRLIRTVDLPIAWSAQKQLLGIG
jgi:hypothetical protein